jgi:hypothetical protein
MRIEIKRAGELKNYEKLLTENAWEHISVLTDLTGKQLLTVRNENQEYEFYFYTGSAIALCYGDAAIFDGILAVGLGRDVGNSRKLRIAEIDIHDPEYLPDEQTEADIHVEYSEVNA